ncbi:MAG TPA: SufS family cysteine desulfurase [Kofleriaceae bacterium]|nr:SufS family cysteine desulfurase [Kofleriaceae bacterium]
MGTDGSRLDAWRRQFPALAARPHGRRLAYLDSASTCLRPQAVIDAVSDVARLQAGNVHRAVHALAEAATTAFDDARVEVARWLGAAADEVVFTSGTTASINLVAASWGRTQLGAGDVVLVSALEHHANLVPWQLVCRERGASLRIAPLDDGGRIDAPALTAMLDERVKLVAISHLSNVLGTIAPVAELARAAHAAGARLLVDGAQAVAHLPVDVAALGCDFYACSGHKVYGPTGTGVLWGRRELLDTMPPWQAGGEMVASVGEQEARFRQPPHRFEAGTPNIAGVIGLGAAVRWWRALDHEARAAHEQAVHARLVAGLRDVPGVRVLGAPEAAVAAFTVDGVHPHDVATILDEGGVAIRGGHHCAEPLHRRLGVAASARASLGLYSGDDDVDALLDGLARVGELLGPRR